MNKTKTIYAPTIVLTDAYFPLVDGKQQYIGARKAWGLIHIQALEWISSTTKQLRLDNLNCEYHIEMKTCEAIAA